MCQIDNLEALADAGACSFKIEGRLKDAGYVKNVVSAYSQRLDEICRKHPQKYARPSFGRPRYEFEANLKKTFNRGFTNYFLKGRQPDIASFDTPKAIGEFVGKVKEIRGNSFNVASIASFTNGDGLCFINDEHELEGFRVNRAQGNRLYPLKMPMNLRPGMGLYRNNDQAFEKILAGKTAERKIPIRITFSLYDEDGRSGFSAEAQYVSEQGIGWGSDDSNYLGKGIVAFEHNPAQKPQHDNIVRQLSKLGGTIYECREVEIKNQADNYFIPSSVLTELRRNLMEDIEKNADISSSVKAVSGGSLSSAEDGLQESKVKVWQREYGKYGYLYNIANKSAHEFYKQHGMNHTENAFELSKTSFQGTKTGESLIMQCRHCIRYSLGYCVKRGGRKPTWKEPLYLELGDGRRFRLEFACNVCQMNIYSD